MFSFAVYAALVDSEFNQATDPMMSGPAIGAVTVIAVMTLPIHAHSNAFNMRLEYVGESLITPYAAPVIIHPACICPMTSGSQRFLTFAMYWLM
jgi:hypothetical protein